MKNESATRLFLGKKADYYERKWEKAEEKEGRSFNGAAFFFSLFWLGYRKQYKTIVFINIGFLLLDLLLFLIGYEYPATGISPIDQGIGISMGIMLGLYGNKLYQNKVQKEIEEIDCSTEDPIERKDLYQKKGGTSWLGVLITLGITLVIYIIPSSFIPMQVDPVEEVQLSEIEYLENGETVSLRVDNLFNELFEEQKWEEISKSKNDHKRVQFEGVHENLEHLIQFEIFEDYTQITDFSIDGKKLEEYTDFEPFDYLLKQYSAPTD